MTFHNIFSVKKTNEKNKETKETIIVDNREKNSLVPSELINLNFNIEFKQLEIGDYIVKGTIIERKTFSDLQSSIINKRIFEQLKNMQNKDSLLIIEGFSNKFIHENAIRGFLLSLATEFKVPFIFTENEKETAIYISILAKKEKNNNISLRQKRISLTKAEQQQFILEGFPGIGITTAKNLIKEFKSLKNIFTAKKEDLEKVIGKKSDNFFNILN